MTGKHELRVSAQYSEQGEFWKVEVLRDGHIVASADRLPSSMKAREAGEYLAFGISEHWSLLSRPTDRALAASLASVKSDMEAERPDDPSYDGFMAPARLLRMVFGTIRTEQIREFCGGTHDINATDLVSGQRWKLISRPWEDDSIDDDEA